MKFSIQAHLDYFLPAPTDVLLQLEAAVIPEQHIEAALIRISQTEHFARVPGLDGIGDRIWLHHQGQLLVDYSATVTINRTGADLAGLAAVPAHQLPGETVQYLMPSRYCPSDKFYNFAEAQFGRLSGGARVLAIQDWIRSNFAYVPGASNSSTDALESFVMRQGVCRDYAHVLIALARASKIPARFVCVYAPDVSPQDFHAVAEVFLDGSWHLVDATRMARAEGMATIAVGRDAAETPFMASYGVALLNCQTVQVVAV